MYFARFISLFFLIACQAGIKWEPDFYIGDYEKEAIMNENGQLVYANEAEFNNYACLSEQKVKELSEILTRARMPRKEKKILLENLPKFPLRF